jgi:alpha-ketoglutarate-dependent taurine dioxygenase
MCSTQTPTNPKINELNPGFGVEIQGLDFSEGASENDRAFIEELVKIVSFCIPRSSRNTVY